MDKNTYFVKNYVITLSLLLIIFLLATVTKNTYIFGAFVILPLFMNYSTYKLARKNNFKKYNYIFFVLACLSILAITMQLMNYNKITNLIAFAIFLTTYLSPTIIYNTLYKG